VIPATARRAEHSLAASSQIRMLACVKGLLTHANGIGYTPINSGKGVALATLLESKRDKTLFQYQSMKMLVTAQNLAEATETEKRANTQWRDYLLNEECYFTGGRISEVLALRWRDIYAPDWGGEMKIVRGNGARSASTACRRDSSKRCGRCAPITAAMMRISSSLRRKADN
jgi:site-specific recombinase XerD